MGPLCANFPNALIPLQIAYGVRDHCIECTAACFLPEGIEALWERLRNLVCESSSKLRHAVDQVADALTRVRQADGGHRINERDFRVIGIRLFYSILVLLDQPGQVVDAHAKGIAFCLPFLHELRVSLGVIGDFTKHSQSFEGHR